MFYVYIIKSRIFKNKFYIGFTENLKQRLTYHNQGQSKHTSKFKPWKIESYFAFSDKGIAIRFEKYLKIGSGKAFMNKRLIKK